MSKKLLYVLSLGICFYALDATSNTVNGVPVCMDLKNKCINAEPAPNCGVFSLKGSQQQCKDYDLIPIQPMYQCGAGCTFESYKGACAGNCF